MTRVDLDELVKKLELAVSAAQSKAANQQECALQYQCEQHDGRISAVNYALVVPSSRSIHGHVEMIEIPLCTLRANRMYQATRVSVQFTTCYRTPNERNAETEPEHGRRGYSGIQRILNWFCTWPKRKLPRRTYVELRTMGSDALVSELRINGERHNRLPSVATCTQNRPGL